MALNPLATTPEPPYFAVIFTSQRTDGDNGYGQIAERMFELATQQTGFLGVETVRNASGVGITISYWANEEAIRHWKANTDHVAAQQAGQRTWYQDYRVRIARVEREYGKPANP